MSMRVKTLSLQAEITELAENSRKVMRNKKATNSFRKFSSLTYVNIFDRDQFSKLKLPISLH